MTLAQRPAVTPLRALSLQTSRLLAPALDALRTGRVPWVAVTAGLLWLTGNALWSAPSTHATALRLGGVHADMPLAHEVARIPVSLFLPTEGLPLLVALVLIVAVLGAAELTLGPLVVVVVAIAANLASTLAARAMLAVGPAAIVGLPAGQGHALDTGPSVAITAVGTLLLIRRRSWFWLSLVSVAFLADAIADHDLDSREHLVAVVAGFLAAPLVAALRDARRARTAA